MCLKQGNEVIKLVSAILPTLLYLPTHLPMTNDIAVVKYMEWDVIPAISNKTVKITTIMLKFDATMKHWTLFTSILKIIDSKWFLSFAANHFELKCFTAIFNHFIDFQIENGHS